MPLDIHIIAPQALDEFEALLSVLESTFEMEPLPRPDRAYLQELLNKNDFFAVVAKAGDQIIAGLTVYVLAQYFTAKPLAYVFDLAVLPPYQRQGIGSQLLQFTTHYCADKGYDEVFIQADKVDEYAVKFYRSTRPTNEMAVVHFSYALGK